MSRFLPIITIVILALLISGGYFLCWPKYQEFSEKRLELEGKDAEIKQKEEHLAELNVLSDKLAEYKDELAKIDSALPTDPSIPTLFNFMLKTSAQNGLILNNINLGGISSSKEGGVREISLSISVSGSYSAFKNFLSAIYKNVRLFEVNSISFSSPGEEDLFTFGLTLKTHAYQEPKTEEGEDQFTP